MTAGSLRQRVDPRCALSDSDHEVDNGSRRIERAGLFACGLSVSGFCTRRAGFRKCGRATGSRAISSSTGGVFGHREFEGIEDGEKTVDLDGCVVGVAGGGADVHGDFFAEEEDVGDARLL